MSTGPVGDSLTIGDTTLEEGRQYLTFLLAGEEYAVDILRVQEIRGFAQPTKIPNAPSHVRGVINIRGAIVPIIDLRQRLGLDVIAYGRTTVVIVARVEGSDHDRTMGIVVDAVSDVYNVRAAQVRAAPDLGGGADADFAQRLATVDDKTIIILELDRLLGRPSLGEEAAARESELAPDAELGA